MALEFKLPDIGEGLTEGEVTKWLVKEGDTVAADQPMVEVLTDKATVEITSPRAGTIQKILVPDGTKVPVGTVIVVIGDGAASGGGGGGGGSAPSSKPAAAPAQGGSHGGAGKPAPAPARAPQPQPAPVAARGSNNGGAAPARPQPQAPAPQREPAREPQRQPQPVATAVIDENRVVLAAPATRALARERGIDLRAVPGTGPNGRITRTDLEGFQGGDGAGNGAQVAPGREEGAAGAAAPARSVAPPAAVAVGSPATAEGDEHVPIRGLRGKIAEQMLRSKQHSPHFTFADECDVTELVALREQSKALAEERGVKLTYLPFVIKALVAAFKRFPTINAVVDDTKNEYVIRREYNVGIATDTQDGLMVPVVRNVDRRTILDIGKEIERLTTGARERKIALHDLRGGTFTITSAGSIGGILATPILNYPEVGILGVYKIADRAVVKNGQIVVRKMMNLSITLDHRIVDGATAAYFLNLVIKYLESPNLLLLEGI